MLPFTQDENEYLNLTSQNWQLLGTHLYPDVEINGVLFKGQVNPENIFEAICFGFNFMPGPCKDLLLERGVKISEEGLTTTELVVILSFLVMLNCLVFLIYKQNLQREMQSEVKMQVSSAVSQYVALS